MAKATFFEIKFSDYHIPLKLYKEWRASVRYSIGRKHAILRIPLMFPRNKIKDELARFEFWLKNQFEKSPKLAKRFVLKRYSTGQKIFVREEEYLLKLEVQERKTSVAKLKNGVIEIRLDNRLDDYQYSKTISGLIANALAKNYKEEIKLRVLHLNYTFFKQEINDIRLKYNQSNWGSCSTGKNINLSSRLLLAPPEVLDYVIIHELAHLIEPNHSDKFWSLVRLAMPDYKEKEHWLKQKGHSLIF